MANLDSSYQWLTRKQFVFPYTLDLIVRQMHQAARDAQPSITQVYAGEAIQLGDSLGRSLERGVVRLECAVAYSKLKIPELTPDLLRQGVELLLPYADKSRNHKHYYAVANWLLGGILINSPHQRLEVIYKWNTSLEAFGSLVYHPENITGDEEWYRNRHRGMQLEIKNLITQEPLVTAEETDQSIPIPEDWPIVVLYPGAHKILEVIGEIPAGGFGPAGSDPFCKERIHLIPEMDLFRLFGGDYRMYNLRGSGRVIRLVATESYFILRVTGDSMDLAKIDSGDYVLLRLQKAAENGEIVAAGILAEEHVATLKRYRERNGVIVLQPESRNERWKKREFGREDLFPRGDAWKIQIHGVALAVFKPSRKRFS
ncbi:MAG TPA: S24 family peptidase [Anaerolineales bacterium]|nr:S24 family peptidase [Anaerolineales bacterium]